MRIEGKEYRTIWFENNVVKIIDQTKLPHQFIIKDLKKMKLIPTKKQQEQMLVFGACLFFILIMILAIYAVNTPSIINKNDLESNFL